MTDRVKLPSSASRDFGSAQSFAPPHGIATRSQSPTSASTGPMAPSYLSFNSRALRSYLYRVPLATRLFTVLIFALCIAGYFAPWLPEAGALYPNKVSLIAGEIWILKSFFPSGYRLYNLTKAPAHRLTTYPFVHKGFFHMFFNLLALVPLLERFESEYGTLISLAMFTGRTPFASPGRKRGRSQLTKPQHSPPYQA